MAFGWKVLLPLAVANIVVYGANCGVESLRTSCWLLASGQKLVAS